MRLLLSGRRSVQLMSDDAAECLECLLALVVGQSQPEPAQWWSPFSSVPRGGDTPA